MDLEGSEIHRTHRWKDPCEVDVPALRAALGREFVWNLASQRFDIDESGD